MFCVADLQFNNQKLQEEVRKLKQAAEVMEETNQKLIEENEELKTQAKTYSFFSLYIVSVCLSNSVFCLCVSVPACVCLFACVRARVLLLRCYFPLQGAAAATEGAHAEGRSGGDEADFKLFGGESSSSFSSQ